jgi:hypothetical protein
VLWFNDSVISSAFIIHLQEFFFFPITQEIHLEVLPLSIRREHHVQKQILELSFSLELLLDTIPVWTPGRQEANSKMWGGYSSSSGDTKDVSFSPSKSPKYLKIPSLWVLLSLVNTNLRSRGIFTQVLDIAEL